MGEAEVMKDSIVVLVMEDGRPPVNIITNEDCVEHDMSVIHYIDDEIRLTAWKGDVREAPFRLYDSLDSYMRDRFHLIVETEFVEADDDSDDE